MTRRIYHKIVPFSALATLSFVVLASAISGPAHAKFPAQVAGDTAEAPPARSIEYAYGSDRLQKLDFWRANVGKPAPLIIFVHGGGWKRGDKKDATGSDKVAHFLREGYSFASIDYRLVPDATVEQQAADIAASVAWLRRNAGRLGIDPSRIVLMGHSAGAHLVTLVGTDPRYLTAAGVSISEIRGVIALDGAGYDVPLQITQAGHFLRETYLQAFGNDPARQRQLSPTFQVAAPNAAAFLLLHIDRADGKTQTDELAAALAKAGTPVQVRGLPGTGLSGHMEINFSLGAPDFPATAIVDDWLNTLPHFRVSR